MLSARSGPTCPLTVLLEQRAPVTVAGIIHGAVVAWLAIRCACRVAGCNRAPLPRGCSAVHQFLFLPAMSDRAARPHLQIRRNRRKSCPRWPGSDRRRKKLRNFRRNEQHNETSPTLGPSEPGHKDGRQHDASGQTLNHPNQFFSGAMVCATGSSIRPLALSVRPFFLVFLFHVTLAIRTSFHREPPATHSQRSCSRTGETFR